MLHSEKHKQLIEENEALSDFNREEALSGWSLDIEYKPPPDQDNQSVKENKAGFVICTKCIKVFSVKELKCPYCGNGNKLFGKN